VTDATHRLLQEALTLGPDERAALAAELLASLDESESDVQAAWAAEIERRSRIAAEERGEDWRVVLEDIRASVLAR
jgi:putative addiction module component (TIGR02574 family)